MSTLTVTRIGHACQLIQTDGTRVLTDPWFIQTATDYHGEPVASTVETLGQHGVREVTFMIQATERTVFFGGTRCAFRN